MPLESETNFVKSLK